MISDMYIMALVYQNSVSAVLAGALLTLLLFWMLLNMFKVAGNGAQ